MISVIFARRDFHLDLNEQSTSRIANTRRLVSDTGEQDRFMGRAVESHVTTETEAQDLAFILGANRHAASLVGDSYCFFAGPGDLRRIPITRISRYQRGGWIVLAPRLDASITLTDAGLQALRAHFAETAMGDFAQTCAEAQRATGNSG